MFLRFVVLGVILFSTFSFADKETIVSIGGITVNLTKSTSCNREKWGMSDENACRCCITKHDAEGDSTQSNFAYCSKKSKHCTDEALRNIAAKVGITQTPIDPDTFVSIVAAEANLIPQVTLNERALKEQGSEAGQLSNESAVYFLQVAAQKGFIRGEYSELIKKGNACLETEKSVGGAQTLQLFRIKLKKECNADIEKTIFILKEMKKPKEEVSNLDKIRNSKMSKYLVENNPSTIAIALAHQNLVYVLGNKAHFMSLLPTAPGKSFEDHLQAYLKLSKTGTQEAIQNERGRLQAAFCDGARALGKFNEENMVPKGAIFGKTVAHRDLHIANIFVLPAQGSSPARVTLIDNESMADFINKPQPVSIDLVRIFAHSTSRFFGKSGLYDDFPKDEWKNIFVEPFIRCYADSYPKARANEVKRELKRVFTQTGVFDLLKNQSVLYNALQWSRLQKDLGAIIDGM